MTIGKRIKKIIKVLLVYNEDARIDLFAYFPWIKRFYQRRRNLFYLRGFGDLAFTLIIFLGLFGPQDPERNVSLFLAWGIWWVTIVMSWFFLGRFWCALCPFPGIGHILQKLGLSLNRTPPVFLTKHCTSFALSFFALIIWVESVTGMKQRPFATALLLLSIVLGATIMALLFRGQSWCRYLCPMGKIIGSAATLSMIELRPQLDTCRTCRTFPCKKGTPTQTGCPVFLGAFNVKNNIDCLLCGRCLTLCDKDSPRLHLRNPFVELIINKGRHLTCSMIIPFLIGSQFARFIQHGPAYTALKHGLFNSNALTFSLLLALCFAGAIQLIRLGSFLFTTHEDPVFGKFSPMVPVLVPLAFTGELAYRLEYFLAALGDVLPTFGRQFGMPLEHLSFSVSTATIHATGLGLMAIGMISGNYVLHLFNTRDFAGMIPPIHYALLHLLVLLTGTAYALIIP